MPAPTAQRCRSQRKSVSAPGQSLSQAKSDTPRSVSWLTDQRMGCSPSRMVRRPPVAAPFRARTAYSPLTVAGTAADLNRIPVTLALLVVTRSPPRAQSSLSRPAGASLRTRVRACGPSGRPCVRTQGYMGDPGAQRRERERAPELMRGKPSGPDGQRPALEGAIKKTHQLNARGLPRRGGLLRLTGGAEGDRTPDLVIANDALSQLSYGPVPVFASPDIPIGGAGERAH